MNVIAHRLTAFGCLIFILLFPSIVFGQEWIVQESLRHGIDFYGVRFFNTNTGCIVGANGTILRSNDGGLNWTDHSIDSSNNLYSIVIPRGENGWIVGARGLILYSSDSCYSWHRQFSGVTTTLRSMSFVGEQYGWIIGDSGTILHTTNGGGSWVRQEIDISLPLTGVSFIDSLHGWAVGGNTILSTSNGGSTWSVAYTVTLGGDLKSVALFNMNRGLAVVENGIYSTADGGSTWIYSSEPYLRQTQLFLTDSLTVFMIGEGGQIQYSDNYGQLWLTGIGPTGYLSLYGGSVIDDTHGWIVGEQGLILRRVSNQRWIANKADSIVCYNRVAAMDSGKMIAVGRTMYSSVAQTTDNGNNWEVSAFLPTAHLYDICFTSPTNGWLVGDFNTLAHTTDQGRTWIHCPTQEPRRITFYDSLYGWYDSNFGIIHTTDGGSSWFSQSSSGDGYLNQIQFCSRRNGWAVSELGHLIRTSDGGTTWRSMRISNASLNGIAVFDSLHCLIVGDSGIIYNAINGGNHFTRQNSGVQSNLSGIARIDDQNLWVVGDSGVILHTIDGGSTWIRQQSPVTTYLRSIAFDNAGNGWIVGDSATILHTTNGGTTFVQESPTNSVPRRFALHPNYPNPFNSSTIISYSLPQSGNIDLKIFDIAGREITTFYRGYQSAGNYKLNFDGKNLSSGNYFIHLNVNHITQSQLVTILK